MSKKKFVNVDCAETKTRINVIDFEDLSELQVAVKAMYATLLAGIDAPLIKFYDQQDQQITKWAQFNSLHSKYFVEDGLCLVIRTTPPPSRQPTQVQLAPILRCEIAFYNSIRNVTEQNGWLVFDDNIPSARVRCLYVRASYQSIAAAIMTPAVQFLYQTPALVNQPQSTQRTISKAIITGTPGVGKSLFVLYLLWLLVKDGKRVLLIYHPHAIYYDGQGGVFQFPKDSLPSETDVSFWNADLWCLFDAKGKKEEHLSALPYSLCTVVVSTSPRRELLNDFKKPPSPQIFYMPPWTETELEAIAPSFGDAADWRDRFKILGGIPRHVLESTEDDPTAMLREACKKCELKDCIQIIGLNSKFTDTSKAVHSLVHITSDPPFTKSSVDYASPTALDIMVEVKQTEARHQMRMLLDACEGNRVASALCGYIFEAYAIELLERGGTFKCRRLVHGNKKSRPGETELRIDASARIVAENPESNQTAKQLYVPKSKNYTALDAWIPGIGAFQMTVGKQHDIKGNASDDLEKLGSGANKLYWLLPPLHYVSFTKKTPQDIDQYAVKIPYPDAAG